MLFSQGASSPVTAVAVGFHPYKTGSGLEEHLPTVPLAAQPSREVYKCSCVSFFPISYSVSSAGMKTGFAAALSCQLNY